MASFQFKTYTEYQDWCQKANSIDDIAKTLVELSNSQLVKLRSSRWFDKDSIWGKTCQKIFGQSSDLGRWFLMSSWNNDFKDLKLLYAKYSETNRLSKKKLETTGEFYCLCNRPWKTKEDPTMVQCDHCKTWYHVICIGVDGFDPNASFMCPFCPANLGPTEDENVGMAYNNLTEETKRKSMNDTYIPMKKLKTHSPRNNSLQLEVEDLGNKTGDRGERRVGDDPEKNVGIADAEQTVEDVENEEEKSELEEEGENEGNVAGRKEGKVEDHEEKVEDHEEKVEDQNEEKVEDKKEENVEDQEEKVEDQNEEDEFEDQMEKNIKQEEKVEDEEGIEDDAEKVEDEKGENEEEVEDEENMEDDAEKVDDDKEEKVIDDEKVEDEQPENDENRKNMEEDNSDDDFESPRKYAKVGRPNLPKSNEEINVDKDENSRLNQINGYLKNLEKEFVVTVDWNTWNKHIRNCKGSEDRCEKHSSKSRHIRPSNGFHNMMSTLFHKKNKYCSLAATKTVLHPDEAIEKTEEQQLRLYMNCREGCDGRWVFSVAKIPKWFKTMDINVRQLNTSSIRHKTVRTKGRPLKDSNRDQVKQLLRSKSAFRVKAEIITDPELEGLKACNFNNKKLLNVLRKAKHEEIHKDEYSSDPIQDFLMTYAKLKGATKENKVHGFVQHMAIGPVQALLFTERSLRVFHHIAKKGNLYLQLDATGAIVKELPSPLNSGQILFYSLIANGELLGKQLPFLQFLSSSGTMEDISSYLLRFFGTYQKLFKPSKKFYGIRKMEIDFSKQMISAVVSVFQSCSVASYLTMIWNAATTTITKEEKALIFAVHICKIHLTRCTFNEFKKVFPEKATVGVALEKRGWLKPLDFWITWRDHFLEGRHMSQFYRRCADAIIISGTEFVTDDVQRRIQNISNATNTLSTDDPEFQFEELDGRNPFWKRSPFGQYAGILVEEVNKKNLMIQDKRNRKEGSFVKLLANPYYSKTLLNYFKEDIIPYYPMISKMMFQVLSVPTSDDTTNRIEGYQHIVKNVWFKNETKLFPGAFIRSIHTHHEATFLEYEDEIEIDKSENDDKEPKPANSRSTKSPEKQKEEFQRYQPKRFVPVSGSFIKTLTFVPYGGTFRSDKIDFEIQNTCNFDNVLMILQLLGLCNPVGIQWYESIKSDPLGFQLHRILNAITSKDPFEAKRIWILDVMGKKLGTKGGTLDMIGSERDHAIEPISKFLPVIRTKTCIEPACISQGCLEGSGNNKDEIGIFNVFKGTAAEMLNAFNQRSIVEGVDNFCSFCQEHTYIEYKFKNFPPSVIYYALMTTSPVRTLSKNLPMTQRFSGIKYEVVAYTVYQAVRNHFVGIIVDGENRYVYDGLSVSKKIVLSKNFAYKLDDLPVSTVWLVKSP